MKKYFKESFIKAYHLKKVKNFVFRLIGYMSYLIPKDKNLIVAFVDYETIDGELVPYKFDNVYLLANKIKQENDKVKIVFLASNQFGGKQNQKLSIKQKLYNLYLRLRAKLLLFKQPPYFCQIYTKSQYLFCLGYFIPFKSDYWELKKWWVFYSHILKEDVDVSGIDEFKEEVLTHFTYADGMFKHTNLIYSVSSDYAKEVIPCSHNLPKEAFIKLGYPKSDTTFDKEVSLTEMFGIKHPINKVILFTPTFRDKDMRTRFDANNDDALEGIFGFSYKNGLEKLEKLLVDTNTILITKLHKSSQYCRDLEEYYIKNKNIQLKNCYFLDFETEKKFDVSLYDLFKESDAMIS
ncbi:MAG: CDP-glycerol glycerophosphotransferase family protein, partial [Flavobacteriaceae bacterium]|nr:CDP-glycerol glycerophosphotransferase family protein [Flavobacteriaceae bacterium]